MKVKVFIHGLHEASIYMEDGSTSDIYHNGENMAIQFWQTRLDKHDGFVFDNLNEGNIVFTNLSEGKSYIEDRPLEELNISLSCIKKAIDWHGNDYDSIEIIGIDNFIFD